MNNTKIDNIKTEINNTIMNSPQKRKIEETLEYEENNILNNKRNKTENILKNINEQTNNINRYTKEINTENISELKIQKKLNENIMNESKKRKIIDTEKEIQNTNLKKKKM